MNQKPTLIQKQPDVWVDLSQIHRLKGKRSGYDWSSSIGAMIPFQYGNIQDCFQLEASEGDFLTLRLKEKKVTQTIKKSELAKAQIRTLLRIVYGKNALPKLQAPTVWTTDKVKALLTERYDQAFELSTPYKNAHAKLELRHQVCGLIFERKAMRVVGDDTLLCPYCTNSKIKVGFNDLTTTHPELAREWHPTKNGELTPEHVTYGSEKKVWWQCENHHDYPATIKNRVNKDGCPYCANKKLWVGFNDLASQFPELAHELHPTKNHPLKPNEVIAFSRKKVWWLGTCGHEWASQPSIRTRGFGCPVCANYQLRTGVNDLQTIDPELAKQFHPTLNQPLTPTTVLGGGNTSHWWQCEKGHAFKSSVSERSRGRNCPYCSNKKVLVGFNDLTTTHPNLANEWHPTKNHPLTAKEVTYGSVKKIWWQCEKGHEWRTTPNSRTARLGSGCPRCSQSKGEQQVAKILAQHHVPFIPQYWTPECRHESVLKFDFSLTNDQQTIIGIIEYDGEQHFKPIEVFGGEEGFKQTQLRDGIKNEYCQTKDIPLLRIPYWEFDQIEPLILTFLDQLIH